MRSTGKKPSPEDGPPAQTGVFTRHYLNMQPLRTPCPLFSQISCSGHSSALQGPKKKKTKKKKKKKTKKKKKQKKPGKQRRAPQTLLTRQIQQMQQLLKNSKV
nr:hypothetical protein [Alcaligenes faecalis]